MLMMLRSALMLVFVGTFQDAPELVRSGMEKFQKRDYAGAIEDLSRAIEKAPKEWRIYGLRAEAKKEAGDLDGAIWDDTKAIELNPSHALAYASRAAAKCLKKDFDGAIQDYSEALRRSPKDADLYVKRAAAKLENADPSGAIADCKKALEINPKDTVALLNLASANLQNKDFSAALSFASKAIEIDPGWAAGYDMRGTVEYGKGDYALALKDADRAAQLDGKEPIFHYQRACCLMARSNGKEAKAAFDLALKTADAGWIFRRRAESLLSVLPELTAGASTVPFRRRILEKGRELLSRGETDKAIDVLEEAVRADSKSPEPYEALVGAFLKRSDQSQGDRKRALKLIILDVVALGKGLSPQMQRYLNVVASRVLTGLRWLAHHQMADGRWSGESVVEACRKDGTPKCEGKGQTGSDLRATSLAILSFLGAGFCHLSTDNYDTKPMGETIKNAQQWILAQQKVDGSIGDPASERFLEDHAIATLAMSEVYGTTDLQSFKDPAQKAVDFLVASRVTGKGWAAKAKKDAPDPIATGWALFALQSARLSELKFPADAMDQGLEWLIGATLRAQPARRDVAGTFAAAVASFVGKKPDGELLNAQLKAISEAPPGKGPEKSDALSTFLSSVALRLGDNGPTWQSWGDRAQMTLQEVGRFDDQGNGCPAGSWDPLGPADGPRGRAITTALNLLTLEICFRYVNVFSTLPQGSQNK
jgi:tetratricopeptide (TPR) repeat protein